MSRFTPTDIRPFRGLHRKIIAEVNRRFVRAKRINPRLGLADFAECREAVIADFGKDRA